MDVFLFVGVPFGILLVPFVWAGYAIGGTAGGPDPAQSARATLRLRIGPAALVLLAGALSMLGAAAAATAGAFAHLTDVAFAIEPAALLFVLEAAVDLALAILVILPGWSARRAWILRTTGVYWLCVALPALILADAGPGWLSTDPATAMMLLGLPAFAWEGIAVLLPAMSIWRASVARHSSDPLPADI